MTNTTDSNVQNVTVNNSANSDSSTNVEYSQNFVQVNPKKKPAPIKIVIPVVILCVLATVLIAPLIDANPVVSNRLVGKCKNSNETTYVFNENGIQYYYNLHTLVINAFSDDFKTLLLIEFIFQKVICSKQKRGRHKTFIVIFCYFVRVKK